MIIRFLLGLALVVSYQQVSAQDTADADKDRLYVTDQLRLSLYQEANAQSRVLELLRSGDLLLIDELRGPYARVTTPDGAQGWVKRGFLVSNPTANILLREEQEKNADLYDEIEKLGDSKTIIDTYEKDMDELVTKIKNLEASNREAGETIARLTQEMEAGSSPENASESESNVENGVDMTNMQPQRSFGLPAPGDLTVSILLEAFKAYWKFILAFLLVVLLVSVLVTKIIIETRIKRRFHGVKIW